MVVEYVTLMKQVFERQLVRAVGLQTDVGYKMEHICKPLSLETEEQQAAALQVKQRSHDYRLF